MAMAGVGAAGPCLVEAYAMRAHYKAKRNSGNYKLLIRVLKLVWLLMLKRKSQADVSSGCPRRLILLRFRPPMTDEKLQVDGKWDCKEANLCSSCN
ncbi:hypothetical protein OWV82_024535 [Melia azedarach]|uniref:Uncharacterized protein n=1 Tax=Melia azedarach TaxID=155640 RepID=A0ACC1WSA6_MELAZ|nr:hypothetical protein OWV82_024535 [Melia azedarach]